MAPRQPLNDEQRRLLKIAARMPLVNVTNLALVTGLDEEKVRKMLNWLVVRFAWERVPVVAGW